MVAMTITEFLNARLDEDERHAKLAAEAGHRANPRYKWIVEEWHSEDPAAVPAAAYVNDEYEIGVAVVNGSYAADHIARHDPARVLAEVAAKRALLKRLEADVDGCTDDAEWRGASAALDRVIEHLAAPYADHPDFDPSWRVPTTEENRS